MRSGCGLIRVLRQQLPIGTGENQTTLYLGQLVFWLRFKLSTSWVQAAQQSIVLLLTCEHTGLALSQTELRLQVLRKENHKSWHNDEFHAGTKACNYVHRVAYEPPHWPRDVCRSAQIHIITQLNLNLTSSSIIYHHHDNELSVLTFNIFTITWIIGLALSCSNVCWLCRTNLLRTRLLHQSNFLLLSLRK